MQSQKLEHSEQPDTEELKKKQKTESIMARQFLDRVSWVLDIREEPALCIAALIRSR